MADTATTGTAAAAQTNEPLIRVEGLRKSFGSLEVLKGITLDVKPGQVVEVERLTKQIQAALKNGRLAMADKPKQEPLAPPDPDQDAEPVDLSKLSATDAISRVNEEANPETLKGYMDTEKRRTVIDALKSRLGGLQGAAE